MIQLIFNVLSLYLWAVIFHELGHFIYIKYVMKQKASIFFVLEHISFINMESWLGVRADYEIMRRGQLYDVYASGILFGLIVLFFASVFNIFYAIITPLYFYGCIPDLKNMWRIIKHER